MVDETDRAFVTNLYTKMLQENEQV
jgi:hypothetical protein